MKPYSSIWLFMVVLGLLATAAGPLTGVRDQPATVVEMPVFEVDPAWPAIPSKWVLGIVSSIAVDHRDHVWILHRPASVEDALRDRAAPPVLEFDADGRFVNAWGGDGEGYVWPDAPHGISVDHELNVWITGVSFLLAPRLLSDDMLLKFDRTGRFLKQIGGQTVNRGNADTTNLNRPADSAVNAATNEVFVADGYGNRRIIVLDATTGAFKRMWGAFGNAPEDGPQGVGSGFAPPQPKNPPPLDVEGPGEQQFVNPVHAVRISRDGLVYVADRGSRRVQIFTLDGKYVNQVFINRAGPSRHSAAGIAFSPDPEQRFLYVADYGNSRMLVLARKSLTLLYQFGARSANPGDFRSPHHIAVDSRGHLYTAEVAPGNRAQKFLFKGTSSKLPPNAVTEP
jgi:DNA-binding beta-propeller fold protein YncE